VPSLVPRFKLMVRALLRLDSLGLASLRRRRFRVVPPPGWQPLPRDLLTEWCPPDFPAYPAMLTVFPANPSRQPPTAVLVEAIADARSAGVENLQVRGPTAVTSDHGLEGSQWRLAGNAPGRPPFIRELVVFYDGRFLYTLQLECRADRHADVAALLRAVVSSSEPIPFPEPMCDSRHGQIMSSHWAE
jgi:hypothetical protein